MQFAVAFLNNAMNDDDVKNGQSLIRRYGLKMSNPKWGVSRGGYYFDESNRVIYKGLGSIKYIGEAVAEELYQLSKRGFTSFIDVLYAIFDETSLDTRQLDILVKIEFFDCFGNQRELCRIIDLFELFKRGQAKQINRDRLEGSPLDEIVRKYAVWTKKSGGEAKSYTLLDVYSILKEGEDLIKTLHLDDLSLILKVRNFIDCVGFPEYTTNDPADRRTLFVKEVFPIRRKKDGVEFAKKIFTRSIGSGVDGEFTIFNSDFKKAPVEKGYIIRCKNCHRDDHGYWVMRYGDYEIIV